MPTAKSGADAPKGEPVTSVKPDKDGEETTLTIEKVESKPGETNGKPWTKHSIHAGGFIFGSFDQKMADAAKFLTGQKAKITYEKSGKFLNMLGIEPAEEVPANDGEPIPEPY